MIYSLFNDIVVMVEITMSNNYYQFQEYNFHFCFSILLVLKGFVLRYSTWTVDKLRSAVGQYAVRHLKVVQFAVISCC
jgi:hypothetical protein